MDSSAAKPKLQQQVEVYSVTKAHQPRQPEAVSSAITPLSNSHNSRLRVVFLEGQAKAQGSSAITVKEVVTCSSNQILKAHSQLLVDSLARIRRVLHQALVVSSATIVSNQQQAVDSSGQIINQIKIKEASLEIKEAQQVDYSGRLLQLLVVASSVTMLVSKTNLRLLSANSLVHRLQEASLELSHRADCSVIMRLAKQPIKVVGSSVLQVIMLLEISLIRASSELALRSRMQEAYSAIQLDNSQVKTT